ncbi:uncharacterized protein M437DRAFT_76758 [Aureobasidium melanogenum CBS 110374]|uniref:BTB domain-containing protein n=1 Tax=Aureobasidium melanogenum (strain CBS 110374) TaxID=1043003 RepID=A0A074VPZ1_AURM1|nr:uncharacterized protein M437DRAFT_76758 [Aureobasidium melanogenum CBS 110374]KEQ61199.1 hypothetical protein M437DRAFT_76758 [Aureobasidium melanogenum CBS 110374]
MASSMNSHGPSDSKLAKAAKDKSEWERSTWNSEYVTYVDGKIFSASVHKELLCFFSPYYTAALKGIFAEALNKTLTLDLPNHQMANLVSWLYSGNTIDFTEYDLLDLYVFADEKMMLAFRRSIMTRLIQFHDPGYEHMEDDLAMPYVKRLPESSGLFRYFIDYWVGMAEWDVDGRIPRKFFYEALERFGSLSEDNHSEAKSGDHRTCLARACNYHEHVNKTEWRESTWEYKNMLQTCADIRSLWSNPKT